MVTLRESFAGRSGFWPPRRCGRYGHRVVADHDGRTGIGLSSTLIGRAQPARHCWTQPARHCWICIPVASAVVEIEDVTTTVSPAGTGTSARPTSAIMWSFATTRQIAGP